MGKYSTILTELTNLRRREIVGDESATYTWNQRIEELGITVDRTEIDMLIELEDGIVAKYWDRPRRKHED